LSVSVQIFLTNQQACLGTVAQEVLLFGGSILEEATSSLDSLSERLIQEALETLMRARTSSIIAHRLAIVRHVDRMIVIAGRHVVESGTHDELQAIEDGVYRRLASLQFRE
jgi:ABC-type multidrug transport system fused ATPase/permease subunit